ncbi:hypothetical protein DFH09DRAFT_1379928 [Mycena vulgaris]|nr:hypothetical protein DFH09DRAFT_1379928 [Mycena vulgaris]
MPAPIPAPSKATMPSTRSARLRDSATPFNALFYRARRFTINGGTFNIGSQPRDTPSLLNRISRYIEHFEVRLAELEDLKPLLGEQSQQPTSIWRQDRRNRILV